MRGLFNPGRFEGAGTPFEWPAAIGYSRQPYASLVAGAWQLAAGSSGLQLGIFGWADPDTGQVSNVQMANGRLGFVLPVLRMWNWNAVTRTPPGAPVRGLILREGLPCVLAAAGDFRTVFPTGAEVGDRVYTDPATGVPYGSDLGGFVATPWTVMESSCECGQPLRISSFVSPLH